MPAERITVEIWLIVDQAGDTAIGTDEEQAAENYRDDIGGDGPLAFYRLTLNVPLPRVRQLAATVPDAPAEDVTLTLTEQ